VIAIRAQLTLLAVVLGLAACQDDTFNPPDQAQLTVTFTPDTVSAPQGGTTPEIEMVVESDEVFGDGSLFLSPLTPEGITAEFDPTAAEPNATTRGHVVLSVASSVAIGRYEVPVRIAFGNLSLTKPITLDVTAPTASRRP
jgi:hypothetical protein